MDNSKSLAEQIGYAEVGQIIHIFYLRAREHPQLKHFFSSIEDFGQHERRITDFWWQALGGELEQETQFDMIGKHFPLGIQSSDLEAWLVLFGRVLGENLKAWQAQSWMDKALTIATRLKQIVVDHKPLGPEIKQRPEQS